MRATRRPPISVVATSLALVAALGLGACGPRTRAVDRGRSTTSTAPATVRVVHLPLVDRSRPTVDPQHALDAPDRALPTTVWLPASKRPAPLVVLAHGNGGDPAKFSRLLGAWARAGYVAAAPRFPLTHAGLPGGSRVTDYVHQPADVSFVIGALLAASARHDHNPLAGRVDRARIGVAGLSLGGATVYGVAFDSCCRDPRVRSAIVMSGIRLPFPGGTTTLSGHPLLLLHGDHDPTIPYQAAVDAYAAAAPPKWFVTLVGGLHSPSYEDTPDPHHAVVDRVTVDFWDLTLRHRRDAENRLLADSEVLGLATIRHDGG